MSPVRWVLYVALSIMVMWAAFMALLLGIGVVSMVREWWLECAR